MSSSITSSNPLVTASASIEAYNRGPITSVYYPPTSCLSTLTMQDYELVLGHWLSGDPACYPPGTLSSDALLASSSWIQWYYSPAACPSGWSVAHTLTSTMEGYGGSIISIGSSTTAALCCPLDFGYYDDDKACTALVQSGQEVHYVSPASYYSNMTYASSDLLTTTLTVATTILADGVPIMYQESDTEIPALFTSITESRSSTSTTSTQTSSSASAPSNTSSQSATSTSDATAHAGLSTGAKAAIGVCIPVALIAVALGVFFFFRRRKQTKHTSLPTTESPRTGPPGGPGAPAAELAATDHPAYTRQINQTPVLAVPQIRNEDYDMSATVDFGNYNELEAPYHGSGYYENAENGNSHVKPTSTDYTLVPNHDPHENHTSPSLSPNLTQAETVSAEPSPTPSNAIPARKAVSSVSSANPSPRDPPAELASHVNHSNPASPRLSESYATETDRSRAASPNPSTTPSANSGKLDVLRERIDRIRAEKERLSRITELEQMEANLQREILDAQRREMEENH